MVFRIGGDWFSPAAGRYVGQFLGTADGPVQHYAATVERPAHDGNTIRWFFATYNLDGTPVVNPKAPGEVATAEGMSSDTVGVGRGTVAKARTWLTKLLESKGLTFVEPQTAEDVNGMVESVKGTFVYMTFVPKKQGPGTVLVELERMQQPALGGRAVLRPDSAATAIAAPPPPNPAWLAAAPVPIPTATSFVPTAVPGAAATAAGLIPVMPFPAAG